MAESIYYSDPESSQSDSESSQPSVSTTRIGEDDNSTNLTPSSQNVRFSHAPFLSQQLQLALHQATTLITKLNSLNSQLIQQELSIFTAQETVKILTLENEDKTQSLNLAHMQILFLKTTLEYYEHALQMANNSIKELSNMHRL